VSSGGPDLFVVCKNCGSEVSPYITECPYCGNRLRKRAPKIDREGRVAEKRRRRPPSNLPRLRRGEIPGIRPDAHPYGTILLVALGIVGAVLWRTGWIGLRTIAIFHLPGYGSVWAHPWRLVTASFVYNNTGYAFVAIGAVAVFGYLIEHRHGPVVMIGVFLIGAVGGLAVTAAVYAFPASLGGNGGALALVCAWAVPDLIDLRNGEEIEGDLLAAGVIAVVIALIPLAAPEASWVAGGVGAAVGLALGFPLARLSRR
jgi:membrane associated rhomboid family serine protease